jgi:putative ABC transport system permease protein
MFIDLFKYSLRSFKRQRAYVIINILGLSIGIACSLLIAFFVMNETSYDRYNSRKDRIFRINFDFKIGGQEMNLASSSGIMGPTMLRDFPEVEGFLRMLKLNPTTVEYNKAIFSEEHLMDADSSFFNFFSIPVIKGDIRNMLNGPGKVVLSQSAAKRIFGTEDPIDKIIKIGKEGRIFSVSGIMSDIPQNSHFEADFILSYMSDPWSNSPDWTNNNLVTYLLLKPNSDYKNVEEKIPGLINKYVAPEIPKLLGISFDEFITQGNRYRYYLQNLKDIHLDRSVQQQFKEPGDPGLIKILASIAILILIIAAINFTNLATAQASQRAKEVGIKKISGSSRAMLIRQFLSESFVLSLISTAFGLAIIKLVLPWFNNIMGTNLELNLLATWYLVPMLVLFSVLAGILSGGYPAFFISSLSPDVILKGFGKNNQSGRLRRILVVFQFAVSIFLIVGTLVMYQQIKFMLNKDVGFNKEHLLVIGNSSALGPKINSFTEAVKTIPGVSKITSSTCIPGVNDNNNGYMVEGKPENIILMSTNWIDYDYIETLGMTLISGRTFNKSYTTDNQACLINEAAVKSFGITDPEKTRFMETLNNGKVVYYQIIGVVKNFNFESLHKPIKPYVYRFKTDRELWGYVTLKVTDKDTKEIINNIDNIWKQFTTDVALTYFFLDEELEQLYIKEKQNAGIAGIASILAILIAVVGLFGLISFTMDQRTKEIGVRKAMGSSVTGVFIVLSKEVIILVSVSSVIAIPLIYYIAGNWLENFYFRIHLGVFYIITGLTIVLGIVLLTISYRILRAARVNPARSLKYE